MSILTKLRDYVRVPWLWATRVAPGWRGKWAPPPDDTGSAGVPAKLPPHVPVMSGANARPFPPED